MSKTFHGGVHPHDYKSSTNKLPIELHKGSYLQVIHLHQHIGAALTPLVKAGENVRVGQLLADSDTFLSAPIHSSVSGVIREIEPKLNLAGLFRPAVVIENDGKYDTVNYTPMRELSTLSKDDIIKQIRKCGIIGMGGAGFPTHVKLTVPEGKKAEHIIINGAECEPYLTSDHRVMLENGDDVLYGLWCLMHAFNLKKGYVGVENNKKDAIENLTKLAINYPGIDVVPLKKKYPQGAEKQLIYAITGKKVPIGKLPIDVGAIVNNIDTSTAISRAIRIGSPVVRRVVTVSGDCVVRPANFMVPIGTSFEDVFAATGKFSSPPRKIIMGGPMMGMAQYSLETHTTKTSSALLAFSEKATEFYEEQTCLHCGKCVEVCPMNLVPYALRQYAGIEDFESCKKNHIMACMSCGACSYICPSRRHLAQGIKLGKTIMAERKI